MKKTKNGGNKFSYSYNGLGLLFYGFFLAKGMVDGMGFELFLKF